MQTEPTTRRWSYESPEIELLSLLFINVLATSNTEQITEDDDEYVWD